MLIVMSALLMWASRLLAFDKSFVHWRVDVGNRREVLLFDQISSWSTQWLAVVLHCYVSDSVQTQLVA